MTDETFEKLIKLTRAGIVYLWVLLAIVLIQGAKIVYKELT
jgi:hypothetical protein